VPPELDVRSTGALATACEEDEDPGMVSVCPLFTTVPLMLFALCIEDIETPCFAAMPPSVSPDLTVYF